MDETDNDIVNLLESSKPSSPQPLQSTEQDPTLGDILTQPSTDLIHTFAASINQSAMKEAGKTEEFRQEIKRRLFRAIIGTYVWSNARLAHETETAEGRLAKGVQELLSVERDQGRSSPPTRTILGRQALLSLSLMCVGMIVAADVTRQDRLRGRLSELMAAVSRAVEVFGQI